MEDCINLTQAQLNKLCDEKSLPEFLVRIALNLPAPKFLPYPDTIEECAFILAHAPSHIQRNEVTIAQEIWISLSEKEVSAADTAEKARVAYQRAPEGTDIKRNASLKWGKLSHEEIERAATFEEARVAYENSPPRTTWCLAAIRKMAELLLKEEQAKK